MSDLDAFGEACTNLVGQVAANSTLADAIVLALATEVLTSDSGPISISSVLKGAPGGHGLKEFLKIWKSSASHLSAQDVTGMVKSSLACYRLAQGRAHAVDTVWTGPEVSGSEVRRTEAVVNEIIANATTELLIVGYWLVTSTEQIKTLIELLIQKARTGVVVRFVFDPGEKSGGPDNFAALNLRWPSNLEDAPREVYTWSDHMTEVMGKNGQPYGRKLHAKVLVADRRDALVTSANLTHAGLVENLEMGLRVRGSVAGALARHFDLLIKEGILEQR